VLLQFKKINKLAGRSLQNGYAHENVVLMLRTTTHDNHIKTATTAAVAASGKDLR